MTDELASLSSVEFAQRSAADYYDRFLDRSDAILKAGAWRALLERKQVSPSQYCTVAALATAGSLKPEPTFDVKHVVDALLYKSGLLLEANVQFMTVMATAMPYIGRG